MSRVPQPVVEHCGVWTLHPCHPSDQSRSFFLSSFLRSPPLKALPTSSAPYLLSSTGVSSTKYMAFPSPRSGRPGTLPRLLFVSLQTLFLPGKIDICKHHHHPDLGRSKAQERKAPRTRKTVTGYSIDAWLSGTDTSRSLEEAMAGGKFMSLLWPKVMHHYLLN
jgi:hypothetical protein